MLAVIKLDHHPRASGGVQAQVIAGFTNREEAETYARESDPHAFLRSGRDFRAGELLVAEVVDATEDIT